MSSLNLKGLARVAAVVAGLSLGLSACFRPLYGPTASGAIAPDRARLHRRAGGRNGRRQLANAGHYLRSELIYAPQRLGLRHAEALQAEARPGAEPVDARSSTRRPAAPSSAIVGGNADLHPDQPRRKDRDHAGHRDLLGQLTTASRSASPPSGPPATRRSGSPRIWREQVQDPAVGGARDTDLTPHGRRQSR